MRDVTRKSCKTDHENVIEKFKFFNDNAQNNSFARTQCENYCVNRNDCWGCFLQCSEQCQWNALSNCDSIEKIPDLPIDNISQKPGK